MVYAIAAYSITIGVLLLYGVLLQHRARVLDAANASAAGNGLAGAGSDPRRGINLGAALLAPLWMWAHGMRWPGAILGLVWVGSIPLLSRGLWVPLIFVSMIPIAAGAALAFVGNRIAVAHTGIEDAGAFSASQLPWAVAGVVLYAFVLPWAWFFTRPFVA